MSFGKDFCTKILKPKRHYMYHQVNSEILCSAHTAYLRDFFMDFRIKSGYFSIPVLITEAVCVYCKVETGTLNATDPVRH